MAETELQKARRLINELVSGKTGGKEKIFREFQSAIEQMNNKSFDAFKKLLPNNNNKQFTTDTADLIRKNAMEQQQNQQNQQQDTLQVNLVYRTASKLEETLDALRKNPDAEATKKLIEGIPNELQENQEFREEFDQFKEHVTNNQPENSQQLQLLNALEDGNAEKSAEIINATRRSLGAKDNPGGAVNWTYNTRLEMSITLGDPGMDLNCTLDQHEHEGTLAHELFDSKSDFNKDNFQQEVKQTQEAVHKDTKQEQKAFAEDLSGDIKQTKEEQEKQDDYEPPSPFKTPQMKPPGTE